MGTTVDAGDEQVGVRVAGPADPSGSEAFRRAVVRPFSAPLLGEEAAHSVDT